MVDSNHRRQRQQIYSLSPLATREIPHNISLELVDLLITNQLLYQLSYTSIFDPAEHMIADDSRFVNRYFAL